MKSNGTLQAGFFLVFFFFWGGQFCDVDSPSDGDKSGDHPQEELPKFGYRQESTKAIYKAK
jgi:hypothetical protein